MITLYMPRGGPYFALPLPPLARSICVPYVSQVGLVSPSMLYEVDLSCVPGGGFLHDF